MTGWVKIDDDVIFDSAMQALPDELFKTWINVLCLASKNGGRLPVLSNVAFALRLDSVTVSDVLQRFREMGLLLKSEDGALSPLKWAGRHFVPASEWAEPSPSQA